VEEDFHEPINLFIADLRKRMNITHESFASQIGMNLYGLRAIEHLHSYVRTHHLKNIANVVKDTAFYRDYVRWMVKWIFDYDIDEIEKDKDQTPLNANQGTEQLRKELELTNKKLELADKKLELQKNLNEILQEEIKLLRSNKE
jgi:transcriptional regulator with XRE-family HTH domain